MITTDQETAFNTILRTGTFTKDAVRDSLIRSGTPIDEADSAMEEAMEMAQAAGYIRQMGNGKWVRTA